MNKTVELMTLAAQFEHVTKHTWRAPYYRLLDDNQRDSIGDVMIESLLGRYFVCRIENFCYPAHTSIFNDTPVAESNDIQTKYYKDYSHNQLAAAFKHALAISKTPLTTTTIGE